MIHNPPSWMRPGVRVTATLPSGHSVRVSRGTVVAFARDGRDTLYAHVVLDNDPYNHAWYSCTVDQLVEAPSCAFLEQQAKRCERLEAALAELDVTVP